MPLCGEDAGIEPRTGATTALAVRRSNHSARSHPQSARSHPHSARFHLILLVKEITEEENKLIFRHYTCDHKDSCRKERRQGWGALISVQHTENNRARIFKLLRSRRIDSKESIPPSYVALQAGTTTLFLLGSSIPHRLFKNSSTDHPVTASWSLFKCSMTTAPLVSS